MTDYRQPETEPGRPLPRRVGGGSSWWLWAALIILVIIVGWGWSGDWWGYGVSPVATSPVAGTTSTPPAPAITAPTPNSQPATGPAG